jgi:hypothetical protein
MTKTRSTRIGAACGALAIATAFATTSVPDIAAAQSNPTADRVWAQCTLTQAEVTALTNRMTGTGLGTPKTVAFVVIYSFQGNDGQPLTGGGFTGPVICRAPGVNIQQVLQTDNIGTSDVLDVENALILRYQPDGSSVEKRYCHTVDANSDCFRLF